MTYETMDWDAEAKRVALALGVVGECEFRIKNPIKPSYLIEGYLSTGCFQVTYVQPRIGFIFYGDAGQILVQLGLSWQGRLLDCHVSNCYPLSLARALFHLDLLPKSKPH